MLSGQSLNSSTFCQKRLVVEGWRFIAHSYAMVNQWQLLELHRRPDVILKFVELPPYRSKWRAEKGLFTPDEELVLQSLTVAGPDEAADVTFRISLPYDFSLSRSARTTVFATSETQALWRDQFLNPSLYDKLKDGVPKGLSVVTPSRWSAEAYYNAGFPDDQVHIVPHGVDTATFRPLPELRSACRRELSVAESEFVFLSVGAMTGNKGIDILLRAFSRISRRFPGTRLVLKGLDAVFGSDLFLSKHMELLSLEERRQLRGRVTYLGGSRSNTEMAELYQLADAYVSPYRAEGFNIPVLEAIACGVPVICTRGGPTDDFVTNNVGQMIDSRKVRMRVTGREGWRLEPNLEHLIALMSSVIDDHHWRRKVAEEGPKHVQTSYSWCRVVDRLVDRLFDQGACPH